MNASQPRVRQSIQELQDAYRPSELQTHASAAVSVSVSATLASLVRARLEVR